MWKCGRRTKAEIARASRSDVRSDWSTLLGANYTALTELFVLTYNILSTYYVVNCIFTDDPTQLGGDPST